MGEELDNDERIPYWVEVWPAAIHLAEWIAGHPEEVSGRRCLDLGCGLGLCSCVAAALSAKVTAVDREWGAIRYTRSNARINCVPEPDTVQMDWRRPGFRPGSFSRVFAADILYEKRFREPVHAFLRQVLAPEGRVLLSTPRRKTNADLIRWLRSRGWGCRMISQNRITYRAYDMENMLWELSL
jgi:predicted nicotinamide N-methyase